MKKSQIIYGCILVVLLGCYIYTTYLYFLIILLMGLILLLILKVLLYIDGKHIEFDFDCPSTSNVGQSVFIDIHVKKSKILGACGVVEYCLQYENKTLKHKIRLNHILPIHSDVSTRSIEIPVTICGRVDIGLDEIYIYDLFRLFSVKLYPVKLHHILIYPREIDLEITHNVSTLPSQDGSYQYQYKKGNDVSEIYDLKEYIPGDDLRHVHWKMSAKTSQLLVKEGTQYSSYDTVMLVDIGVKDRNGPLNVLTLSTALTYAMNISEHLLIEHIRHLVLFYYNGRFHPLELNHINDYYMHLDEWFNYSIDDISGNGLHLFISEHLDYDFSKLIYITAGSYSKEASKLQKKLEVSGFSFSKQITSLETVKHDSTKLYDIPLDTLNKKLHFDI